jgi:hypothetical protein
MPVTVDSASASPIKYLFIFWFNIGEIHLFSREDGSDAATHTPVFQFAPDLPGKRAGVRIERIRTSESKGSLRSAAPMEEQAVIPLCQAPASGVSLGFMESIASLRRSMGSRSMSWRVVESANSRKASIPHSGLMSLMRSAATSYFGFPLVTQVHTAVC